jgi:hypothetical protein
MAFTLANWTCVSASLSSPQETVIPYGGVSTILNAPNLFTYGSPNDTAAAIAAANYFLPQYASLGVGDIIIGFGTDASFMLEVTAVSPTAVTTASFTSTGSIGTANIVNNAVTFAKFQQLPASTLVANPTGALANAQAITLGNGLSFNGTTLQVNPGTAEQVSVPITLAAWNAMSVTPVTLLAAPGAGLMNIIDSMYINYLYGSAALTGGGLVGAQYGTTAALGGPAASSTEAAADFTSKTANTMFRIGGSLSTGVTTSLAINTAITLSNATAPFAVGTGGSFVVIVNYRTVSAS